MGVLEPPRAPILGKREKKWQTPGKYQSPNLGLELKEWLPPNGNECNSGSYKKRL